MRRLSEESERENVGAEEVEASEPEAVQPLRHRLSVPTLKFPAQFRQGRPHNEKKRGKLKPSNRPWTKRKVQPAHQGPDRQPRKDNRYENQPERYTHCLAKGPRLLRVGLSISRTYSGEGV